jgi:hypothetical protein
MDAPPLLLRTLDSVDPFWNQDAGPIFPPEAIRALAGIDGIEHELLAIATDEAQPLARRFAAVEALFQGGWTDWRTGEQGPVIARVLADAIRADRIHNRWGLPGYFVGRSGADLLSIEDGVEQALAPLLDDERRLTIHGGETSTVADTAGYRIADLAGYLIATRRGEPWPDDPDPAVRDTELERLRRERGAA